MSDPTEPHDPHDGQMLEMLLADNRRLREAGCKLAEAALRMIREYDGTHRLALAVAEWAKAVADEGGRGKEAHVPPAPE